MTKKEIKELFPLHINIVEKDIFLAKDKGGLHYLGDILLRRSLPKQLHDKIFWGLSIGVIDGVHICTTYKEKDMILPLYIDNNFQASEIRLDLI